VRTPEPERGFEVTGPRGSWRATASASVAPHPHFPAALPLLALDYASSLGLHLTSLLEARGGAIRMSSTIPLGTGLPEDVGGLSRYPGSLTVRPETLRAVHGSRSSLGDDGFRTTFEVSGSGVESHFSAAAPPRVAASVTRKDGEPWAPSQSR